jgi:hypothetical protein
VTQIILRGAAGLVALAAVAAVVAALIGLLRTAAQKRLAELCAPAEEYERLGQFEEACYAYAQIAAGRRNHPAAVRVRHLWQEHGPFTFEAIHERMLREYCDRCESCGEGYHRGVLHSIRRIVGVDGPP